MSLFEETMAGELAGLLRAGVPARGVRLTVRELIVTHIERGPLGAREVGDAVQAAMRAVCRLVRELDAPPEVVERVNAIRAVCDRHGVPLPAAALQFPLAHPAVAAIIPGPRDADEEGTRSVFRLSTPSPTRSICYRLR